MEVIEIISYVVNPKTNVLEVSFRLMEDTDEMVRDDSMDYSLAEEYGYNLEDESFDFFDDDFEDDEDSLFDDTDIEMELILDEDQLISFLNEYYTVNPNSLPKPEIY
jgi:hypothetical protein